MGNTDEGYVTGLDLDPFVLFRVLPVGWVHISSAKA